MILSGLKIRLINKNFKKRAYLIYALFLLQKDIPRVKRGVFTLQKKCPEKNQDSKKQEAKLQLDLNHRTNLVV